MRSRSWAVTVTRLLLPEVVNFSNKKSRQGKRSALNSQWFCFSISHSSFASLSADDGCTDGMRFLHMLSIPSGSSVRRWQRKQTWVWASPTAWLGRWGRHVYRHQWEWGKRKNSPEVVNFDLCPNLKQFKSGKLGFQTFQFIPLKRWYPRKEVGKIKVPVSMLAEHASCCSGKTSASMTTTPEFPRTPVGQCHPLPSGPHAFTFINTPFLLRSPSIHAHIERADMGMLQTHPIPWPHGLFIRLPQILSPDSSPSFTSMKTAQVIQCIRASSAPTVQLWIWFWIQHPIIWEHFYLRFSFGYFYTLLVK